MELHLAKAGDPEAFIKVYERLTGRPLSAEGQAKIRALAKAALIREAEAKQISADSTDNATGKDDDSSA